MAGQEDLGKAVLRLSVDDSALINGVRNAKDFISKELGQAFSGKTTGGRGRGGTDDRLQATRIISRRLGDELQKLADRGVNVTRQFKQLNAAITAAEKGQLETARARNKGIREFIRDTSRASAAESKSAAKAQREQAQARLREKRTQAAQARERAQNLQGRISSGLVGGAFPLLFGQGVGAAVGGGLGGLAGGSKFGFGLSLVGTLIGSAFDEAINKAKTLAAALDDPISNFDALKQSALLSSRAVEKQAEALINAGRTAEAYTLIQQDLASRFGDAATAQELLKTTDELNRRWSELSTVVGILISGPLEKLAAQLLNLLGPAGAQLAFETRVSKLTPAQQKQAQQIKETELRKVPSFASSDAYTAAYVNALTAVDKMFGITKQQAALENNMRTSKATQLGIDAARIQIAKEEDRILSLQLQKRQVELEQKRALNALGENPAQAAKDQIQLDTKVKILEIERQISEETKRRDEKQKKAAEDLLNLRLQNIKFLPKAEKQSLIREVGQPAVAEARRRGVTLRSFSDIRDFSQFLKQEQQLRQDAGPELVNSNNQLNGTLQSTAEVVTGLIQTMDSLREKSWEVHVTIPGQNSSKTVDALNQLS